jgi:hypothetical protein
MEFPISGPNQILKDWLYEVYLQKQQQYPVRDEI